MNSRALALVLIERGGLSRLSHAAATTLAATMPERRATREPPGPRDSLARSSGVRDFGSRPGRRFAEQRLDRLVARGSVDDAREARRDTALPVDQDRHRHRAEAVGGGERLVGDDDGI